MERVLEFDLALGEVLAHAAACAPGTVVESIALAAARERVLSQAVLAPRDQPPFDRSTRDGYAVHADDLADGRTLRVLGTLRAGERWAGAALGTDEAVEIMTGAPLPAGADAVLMVEHARSGSDDEGAATLVAAAGRTLRAGENVVARGAEARDGAEVLAPGTLLDAAAIALAASCGRASVHVFARPSAAIIATGDELVELDAQQPGVEQIYNSNSYALAALVEQAGGVAQRLPIARDTLDDLRARLAEAAGADLLLLTGGVSMGKFDLVEQALAEAGAEFIFAGARIQPGKPVVFGRLPRPARDGKTPLRWQYFFGLPGNPVSTEVCFHLFAAPLLRALSGRTDLAPRFVEATVSEAFEGKPGLLRFLPARIDGGRNGVRVRPLRWQGSGDVAANARANAYCVVGERGLAVDDVARVLLR